MLSTTNKKIIAMDVNSGCTGPQGQWGLGLHVAEDLYLCEAQKWASHDPFMGSNGRLSFSLEDGVFVDEYTEIGAGNLLVEEPFPSECENGGEEVGWYEENADLAQWIDSPQSEQSVEFVQRVELAADQVDWGGWNEFLFEEQQQAGCKEAVVQSPVNEETLFYEDEEEMVLEEEEGSVEEDKDLHIGKIKQEIHEFEERLGKKAPVDERPQSQPRKIRKKNRKVNSPLRRLKSQQRESNSLVDKRRELNRIAAQRYRGRKREEWKLLVEEGNRLESRNQHLRQLEKRLQKDISWYKAALSSKAVEAGRNSGFK